MALFLPSQNKRRLVPFLSPQTAEVFSHLVRYGAFSFLATRVVGGRWVKAQNLTRNVGYSLSCTVETLEPTAFRIVCKKVDRVRIGMGKVTRSA